jgi:hypothetical protein
MVRVVWKCVTLCEMQNSSSLVAKQRQHVLVGNISPRQSEAQVPATRPCCILHAERQQP